MIFRLVMASRCCSPPQLHRDELRQIPQLPEHGPGHDVIPPGADGHGLHVAARADHPGPLIQPGRVELHAYGGHALIPQHHRVDQRRHPHDPAALQRLDLAQDGGLAGPQLLRQAAAVLPGIGLQLPHQGIIQGVQGRGRVPPRMRAVTVREQRAEDLDVAQRQHVLDVEHSGHVPDVSHQEIQEVRPSLEKAIGDDVEASHAEHQVLHRGQGSQPLGHGQQPVRADVDAHDDRGGEPHRHRVGHAHYADCPRRQQPLQPGANGVPAQPQPEGHLGVRLPGIGLQLGDQPDVGLVKPLEFPSDGPPLCLPGAGAEAILSFFPGRGNLGRPPRPSGGRGRE